MANMKYKKDWKSLIIIKYYNIIYNENGIKNSKYYCI